MLKVVMSVTLARTVKWAVQMMVVKVMMVMQMMLVTFILVMLMMRRVV